MVEFKIDAMKRNVVNSINLNHNNLAHIYAIIATMQDHPRTWRDVLPEMEDECKQIINNWDARCIMDLVKVFPHIMPKKYHDSTGVLDYNAKGEWIIVF